VQVAGDPGTASYAIAKAKACAAVGIINQPFLCPPDVQTQQLITIIKNLNDDPNVRCLFVFFGFGVGDFVLFNPLPYFVFFFFLKDDSSPFTSNFEATLSYFSTFQSFHPFILSSFYSFTS